MRYIQSHEPNFLEVPEDFTRDITIRWWNVNGRWSIVEKKFMNNTDIIFICETRGSCLSMPEFPGFKIVGDPKFPLISTHGAYVKNGIHEHIQLLR